MHFTDAALAAGNPTYNRSGCWGWLARWIMKFWKPAALFFSSFAPVRALAAPTSQRSFILAYESMYGHVHPRFSESTLLETLKAGNVCSLFLSFRIVMTCCFVVSQKGRQVCVYISTQSSARRYRGVL